MRSNSVTISLQAIQHRWTRPSQASRYLIYLSRRDGKLNWAAAANIRSGVCLPEAAWRVSYQWWAEMSQNSRPHVISDKWLPGNLWSVCVWQRFVWWTASRALKHNPQLLWFVADFSYNALYLTNVGLRYIESIQQICMHTTRRKVESL